MITSFVLVLLLTQSPDAGTRLRLEWRAPVECPATPGIESTLQDTLPANRTFAAQVTLEAPDVEAGPWRAVVLTSSGAAERRRVVEAPGCAQVTQAALLVVTLAATQLASEPEVPEQPVVLPQAPASETNAPPEDLVEGPLAPSDAAARLVPPFRFKLPIAVGVVPSASMSVGVVPVLGGSLGGGVTGWLPQPPVRFAVGLQGWFDGQTPNTSRGAHLSVFSVVFQAAWLPQPWARWHLGPSLGVELVMLRARATGIARPIEQSALVVSALLGGLVGFELSKGRRAWLGVELGLTPLRPSFLIETPTGDVAAHTVSLAVARLSVGFEFEVYSP